MPRPKDVATAAGRARHTAKTSRILDAALRIFAVKGFHEAKISEIAEAAGVADGTIYRYFKNKDDLLTSLLHTKLQGISQGLCGELAGIGNANARLRHVIAYHLRLAEQDPAVVSFVTSEVRHTTKAAHQAAKAQLQGYIAQWARVIDEGKAVGTFRGDLATETVQHLLFGALDHACVAWVNSAQRRPETLDVIGKHLSEMIRAMVQAE